MTLDTLTSDEYARIKIHSDHRNTRSRFIQGFFTPRSLNDYTLISRPSTVKKFIETYDDTYSEILAENDDYALQIDDISVDPIDDITRIEGFALVRCALTDDEHSQWDTETTALQESVGELLDSSVDDPLRYVQTTYGAPSIRAEVPNPFSTRQTLDPIAPDFADQLLNNGLLTPEDPGGWYPRHQNLVKWADELAAEFNNVAMHFLGNIHQSSTDPVDTATGEYQFDGLAVRALDGSPIPDDVIDWLDHRYGGSWDDETDTFQEHCPDYPTCSEFDTTNGWVRLWWD